MYMYVYMYTIHNTHDVHVCTRLSRYCIVSSNQPLNQSTNQQDIWTTTIDQTKCQATLRANRSMIKQSVNWFRTYYINNSNQVCKRSQIIHIIKLNTDGSNDWDRDQANKIILLNDLDHDQMCSSIKTHLSNHSNHDQINKLIRKYQSSDDQKVIDICRSNCSCPVCVCVWSWSESILVQFNTEHNKQFAYFHKIYMYVHVCSHRSQHEGYDMWVTSGQRNLAIS